MIVNGVVCGFDIVLCVFVHVNVWMRVCVSLQKNRATTNGLRAHTQIRTIHIRTYILKNVIRRRRRSGGGGVSGFSVLKTLAMHPHSYVYVYFYHTFGMYSRVRCFSLFLVYLLAYILFTFLLKRELYFFGDLSIVSFIITFILFIYISDTQN